MPEYISGRKRSLSVGIRSYTENTNTLNVIGNVNVSSGRLGIGTTAPSADLHVVGLASTTHVSAYLASAGGITTTGGDLYVAGTLYANEIEIGNIVLDNINTIGVSTFNIIKVNSGIITDLQVTGITTLNNLNVTGVTSTKDLYVDDELYVVGIATANTFNSQSGIFTNVLGVAATFNTIIADNIIGQSTTGILSIRNASIDYLVGVAATITNINSNLGIITNIIGVSGTFNTLKVDNLVGQSTAGILSITNARIDYLVGSAATISNIVANTGIITNIVGTSATFNNVSSLTGIITTLSGTNLNYSGIGTIQTLDVDYATIDNLQTINITNSGVITTNTLDVSSGFEVHANEAIFHENVVINGDLTINGQQTIINTQEKYIKDRQIVLGYSTTNNTDDLTANGGGIAIAASVGYPIVNLYDVGVNTIPSTYKQLIWAKANTYGLGTTDAFLFNYAVGIGSSQVPNDVRLAVKEIQITDNRIYSPYILSGVVTATSFVGTLVGVASTALYAINAGISTNIKGGIKGSVPYQSAPDTTSLLSPGVNGHVLITPGTGGDPFWGPVSAATGFFGGITIRDDNVVVGTAASIGTLNFGDGIVAIAASGPNGIATVSLVPITFVQSAGVSTNVIGGIASVTQLNVTGITTLGVVQINTNGIITSNNPGISTVVYYGDGSKLTGVTAFSVVNQGLIASPVYPTFANSIGVTTVGIASTQVAYVPSSGNLGIGTTSPTSKLHVVGDGLFTGIVTASRFVGQIDVGNIVGTVTYSSFSGIATNVIGGIGSITALTVSGITTTGQLNVGTGGTIITTTPSGFIGIFTATPIQPFQINPLGINVVVVDNTGELGIGTTNPQAKLDVIGNARITGIATIGQVVINPTGIITSANPGVSTVVYYGDGSRLTGVSAFSIINQPLTSIPVFPTFANSIGVASVGIASTQVAYIPSSGNLGIGTTNPTSKLHVIGNALITGVTTSTDFNSSSDRNLKTNIKTIEDPIEKVMRINGVTFDWKETSKSSAGVIAQDVETVMPELVSGDPLTLNYNGLIGLLVEVVKEQQNEINTLKQIINKNS